MYPAVVKVVPHDDFTSAVGLDKGEEEVLDMKPHLGKQSQGGCDG